MFYACGDDNSFRARDNDSEIYSSNKKNSSSSSDKAKSSSSPKEDPGRSSSDSSKTCTYTNLCESVDVDHSSVHIADGRSEKQQPIRCIKDAPSACVEPIPSKEGYKHSYSSVYARTVDPATVEHGVLTDKRDGQTYKTVKIGKQTWMAENLNFETENSTCYNNESECNEYGRYYSWDDAMDSTATFSNEGKGCGYGLVCDVSRARGICPEGWHLPSIEELDTLMASVGGYSVAGKNLKSKEGWPDSSKGIDAYGFSLLPAGYNGFLRDKEIVTEDSKTRGYLLSSTESLLMFDSPDNYFVALRLSEVDYGYTDETFSKYSPFLNVRCLKD